MVARLNLQGGIYVVRDGSGHALLLCVCVCGCVEVV